MKEAATRFNSGGRFFARYRDGMWLCRPYDGDVEYGFRTLSELMDAAYPQAVGGIDTTDWPERLRAFYEEQ